MKRVWNTVLVLTLCLALCAVLMPDPAHAAEIVDSGTCGDNLTWTLDSEGVLTISGTGEMWDYYRKFENPPWYKNIYSISLAVINVGVTSIGNYAFCDCENLKNVIIPESVKNIGEKAFLECTTLSNVKIPNGVKSINEGIFSQCKNLTSVTIPNSVISIGVQAFSGCETLTGVTIPDSVTSISDSAFLDCNSLANIVVSNNNTVYQDINGILFDREGKELLLYPAGRQDSLFLIPDGVTTVGHFAFYGCEALNSVIIPDTVTSLGAGVFQGCKNLTSFNIPNGITSIGGDAIRDTAIYLDEENWIDGFLYIDNILFRADQGLSGKITIKDGTWMIAGGSFSNCQNVTNIMIPNSVTSIGNSAFSGCENLKSIRIPNSVTSIGGYAFGGCSSLTSITIPNSVTKMEWGTFHFCSSLKSVGLPNSLSSIDGGMFEFCFNLTSLSIPDSITSIGNDAFSLCVSLENVFYSGSEEEWKKIRIEKGNNDLHSAIIHYNAILPQQLISFPEVSGTGRDAEAQLLLTAAAGKDMTVYGVRFSEEGQFLGMTSIIIPAGRDGTLTVPFEDGSYLRVFATDAQTGVPLCDCVTVERPE